MNDQVDADALRELAGVGVRLVALRCSGYNNVDLAAAERLGIAVARVPAYSPHAVAEHTVGLMLALDRKLYKAYNRVREGNFNLEGLLGSELYGRTAGIIGTGKIGAIVGRILHGFECRLLVYDVTRNPEVEALGVDTSISTNCAASATSSRCTARWCPAPTASSTKTASRR